MASLFIHSISTTLSLLIPNSHPILPYSPAPLATASLFCLCQFSFPYKRGGDVARFLERTLPSPQDHRAAGPSLLSQDGCSFRSSSTPQAWSQSSVSLQQWPESHFLFITSLKGLQAWSPCKWWLGCCCRETTFICMGSPHLISGCVHCHFKKLFIFTSSLSFPSDTLMFLPDLPCGIGICLLLTGSLYKYSRKNLWWVVVAIATFLRGKKKHNWTWKWTHKS